MRTFIVLCALSLDLACRMCQFLERVARGEERETRLNMIEEGLGREQERVNRRIQP